MRAQIENQMSLLRLVHVTKRNTLIWLSSWAGTEAGISRKTAWAPLLAFTTKFWPQRAQAQAWRLVRGDSSKYQLAACCGLKLRNNESAFAKGACVDPPVPNNQFT